MRRRERSAHGTLWAVLAALAVVLAMDVSGAAAARPRIVLIAPFDASELAVESRWMGEGVAQVVTLGLVQHPGLVLLDRTLLRSQAAAEGWTEAAVERAVRALRADVAVFGRVSREGAGAVVRPRLLEARTGKSDVTALEPVSLGEDDVVERLGSLPLAYARTLRLPLSPAETARIERAARPTRVGQAFELFSRAQAAVRQGGPGSNESASELLARAVEADASFAVAQYTLGVVQHALGNRWKAGAQFRASTQLDPAFPEPYKSLGDLYVTAPRRLYDQAIEAYGKAIELRPHYAEAHVGLGDARAAKGDVDGAITAYQKALALNAASPRVHLSLGKIYYSEKGLYYESVSAYKRAIELDPRSVDARMGLGEVYEDKGLYKEAIEEYRRVMELEPRHTGALYNLALAYEKVDPRESASLWERYIELASQLPSEKDWVDVARQHLRKLRNQLKD